MSAHKESTHLVCVLFFSLTSLRKRGGTKKDSQVSRENENSQPTDNDDDDDYERAEKSIFDAEQKAAHLIYEAEQVVEHAVQDEVNTLFPEMKRKHKEGSRENDSKEKSTKSQSTTSAQEHESDSFTEHLYEQTGKPFFEGKKMGAEILVKAEKAFEHAVEDEVRAFFPDSNNEENISDSKEHK